MIREAGVGNKRHMKKRAQAAEVRTWGPFLIRLTIGHLCAGLRWMTTAEVPAAAAMAPGSTAKPPADARMAHGTSALPPAAKAMAPGTTAKPPTVTMTARGTASALPLAVSVTTGTPGTAAKPPAATTTASGTSESGGGVEGDVYEYYEVTGVEDELIEAFQIFHLDGNGFMSAGMLSQVWLRWGEKLTAEEVDEAISAADVDGDY